MKNIIRNGILFLSIFSVSTVCIHASDTNIEGNISGFKEVVEQTQYYQEYQDNIEKIYVETQNEEGIYTIAYLLNEDVNGTETLVFVGDEDYYLKKVLVVDVSDNTASTKNLLSNQKVRAHLGYCVKDECTSYKTVASYTPNLACSSIVGQACTPLASLPGYSAVLYLLCQGGVFVGCNISTTKKCTAWSHTEYECSVP